MDHTLYVIVAGSFLAALSNAAFSTGGAMIVLAATSAVLPVSAVVPIHSTLLIGSTVSLAVVFREHFDCRIAGPCVPGTVVAVAIAARLYVELPDSAIAIAIAAVMLVAIWLPIVLRMMMHYTRHANMMESYREHAAIVNAIHRKDRKAAIEALTANLQ